MPKQQKQSQTTGCYRERTTHNPPQNARVAAKQQKGNDGLPPQATPKQQHPACPNFARRCGGCPLFAVPYEQQLLQKQATAEALLKKFGPVHPILPAPQPLHYRNKAIATFAMDARGKLTCGTYAAGSHRVLPLAGCLLQADVLNRTLAAVLEAARQCHYEAFDEDGGLGLLRHVLVRCGRPAAEQPEQVLVVLVTAEERLPGSRNFALALRRLAPWVVTLVQNVNGAQTSAVLGRKSRVLFGTGSITDCLCGLTFSLSARSFYQVNPAQTEQLYRTAIRAAALTGRETVVDAYCGIGTIGLVAAGQAAQVMGVEREPSAVKNAVANARANHIANARFFAADATEWMCSAAAAGQRADVVFLDPPRAGTTPDCIRAVAALQPKRVVYVSCSPETLARDAALFARVGYRAVGFTPVDMFPQTEHLEVVALLETGLRQENDRRPSGKTRNPLGL